MVAAYGLTGFVALFLVNAFTYLVYVGVLVAVVRDAAGPEPIKGGYRVVARDRLFIRLLAINVAMIAVGWGVFTWLLPPYAKNDIGISAPLIGLLLLANAATVVVAQMPVARLAEGRRRMVMTALAASPAVTAGRPAGHGDEAAGWHDREYDSRKDQRDHRAGRQRGRAREAVRREGGRGG